VESGYNEKARRKTIGDWVEVQSVGSGNLGAVFRKSEKKKGKTGDRLR